MTDASQLPLGHPEIPARRIGVLLVNLGTPDATDYWSMRRYLKEFLSDRRVIEENRVKWWLILNLIILTVRPGRKGRDYDKIWNKERNEFVLKTITRSQADKLGESFSRRPAHSGRLGDALRQSVDRLSPRGACEAQGCDRILIVPLYPQYAAATTATVCDKAFAALATMRWQPAIRVARALFRSARLYRGDLPNRSNAGLAKLPFKPDDHPRLVSWHAGGLSRARAIPINAIARNGAAVARASSISARTDCCMTFQSRFGTAEWLKPYTDATVKGLAEKGVKNIAVITPGFAADCLETLEEIAMENAEIFRHAGGKNFAAIPCLNDSPAGMAVIRDVVLRELKGWV